MTQLISCQEYEDREEGRKRSRETDSIRNNSTNKYKNKQ
jgi:hypothetical protein